MVPHICPFLADVGAASRTRSAPRVSFPAVPQNSSPSASNARQSAILFVLIFAALLLAHLPLLRLPYFWDEAGYYIPAARDLLLNASFIPHSTISNAHPPLLMAFLAAAWKIFGYSPPVTRTAMLLAAAFTLLGVFRLARQVAGERAAIAAVICTALYPVFFAQSSLAHLDMAAAGLILWGLSYYLQARQWLAILFFALACLAKETAALVPLTLFVWELFLYFTSPRNFRSVIPSEDAPQSDAERSEAAQGASEPRDLLFVPIKLLLSLIPLALWFAYHYARTGYVFGNPEFVRYNLAATLHPTRILVAFGMRLWQLLGYMNMFVLTIAAALALCLSPAFPRRADAARGQAVFLVLILAHAVALAIVGGAVLARYLLPVYPLLIILCIAALRRRVPWWPAFVAVAGAGFVIALVVNPPYRFAPEDNLSYADFVRLHQSAERLIEQRYPARRVLTAWPASDELTRPWLGYVSRPQPVLRIENFSAPEMIAAEQARGHYQLALVFSTKSDAPPLIPLPAWERIQTRYFGFHRDLDPAAAARLLGARILYQQRRSGQWIAILQIETVQNARLR